MSDAAIETDRSTRRGWLWVPTLYFAEGIPYVVVMTVAVIMYKDLGVGNAAIAYFTSWLYMPWVVKALWSPFVDLIGSHRQWVVAMQAALCAAFIMMVPALHGPGFFRLSLAVFWAIALLSATHDIAADGFYMYGLTERGQSWWVGLRSTFYRLAMLAGQGGVVALAGLIARADGDAAGAWQWAFGALSALFAVLAVWHFFALPRVAADCPRRVAPDRLLAETIDTFTAFFSRRHIATALLFILTYRFAEAQLVKMIAPFLLDGADAGGLGLTTARVGLTYGTIGLGALMAGGIAGGFVAARTGLGRCIMPMSWSMSLTCLAFVLLAAVGHPAMWLVDVCVALEQAGYGFGTTAFTLYLLRFSAGKQATSDYAICTGLMALGMMVPGMWAGWLQQQLGYLWFFVWTSACSVTTIVAALAARRTLKDI